MKTLNAEGHFLPLPPRPRCRFLLGVARCAYHLYLRLNGWDRVWLPTPTPPVRLLEKWTKQMGKVRHTLTCEQALALESSLFHEHTRRELKGRG